MASVLIPLAQGCEELEAVTIIDLLRRAEIRVVTAGLDDQVITAARGTRLLADTTIDNIKGDTFDMIVLPGGQPGTNNLDADQRIHKLIKSMAAQDKHIAAVCAAPKVLANAGLLDGKQATAYPGTLEALDKVNIKLSPQPVVQDGNITTSRGPGTAMDFALTLIEILAGNEKRDAVEAGLQRP